MVCIEVYSQFGSESLGLFKLTQQCVIVVGYRAFID